MERERKGRTRPEHGLRPLLRKFGLVTTSKTGELKIVWREIGITVLFVGLLTLFLVPRLQLHTGILGVGDIAPAGVKAPTDFLIEDELSTQQRRAEAEDRVLPVYDLDSHAIEAVARRLASAIQVVEGAYHMRPPEFIGSLSHTAATPLSAGEAARLRGLDAAPAEVDAEVSMASPWFHEREREFQRLLGVELGEDTLRGLRQLRYDAQLHDAILRPVAQVMRRGIVNDKELLMSHRQRGITLRDLRVGRERTVSDPTTFLEMREAHDAVTMAVASPGTTPSPGMQQIITDIARDLLQANVTFNRRETEERKLQAAQAVKPVFFQVKRGEMIIREGERVREEHIPKLKALALESRRGNLLSAIPGIAIFSTLVVALGLLYLWQLRPRLPWTPQTLLLLAILVAGNLLAIRGFMVVAQALADSSPFLETNMLLYALPLAAGGILVAIFFDFQVGILFSLMTGLLLSVLVRDNAVLPVLAVIGNLVATFRVNQYTQRSSILFTGLLIGLANVLTLMAFSLMSSNLFTWPRASEALFGLIGGLHAAVVASVILPLLESIFKLTTDIKLLELASLNHPLLRQLVVHAPGTYHHSMLVGTLAEAAAEAIGANALLARVGSYYHDIGKMLTPEYFVENQAGRGNKHDRLSPSMSALIITAHVKDGIKLAREYKLPQRLIDIIPQHHGTNLITYFYNKAKELEDPNMQQVQEDDYRYPGPKPQTREAAIVMLADKVEAASRVLSDPTPQRISTLVQRIVSNVFMDGQLDECDLTLRGLQRIRDAFVRTLIAIYHHRIAYPAVESEEVRRRTRQTNGHQLSESTKEHSDPHPGAQDDPTTITRSPRVSGL